MNTESDWARDLAKSYVGHLTKKEREFLEDVMSLINFVIDNDLHINLALEVLGHDLNNIVEKYDMNLSKALASEFVPKVSSFSVRIA